MLKNNLKKAFFLFCAVIILIFCVGITVNHLTEAEHAMQVISEHVLIPGGQSVGIKMNVKGVLVVGLEEIETKDGIRSPGYEAGLEIGDMITMINGTPVSYASEVSELIHTDKNESLLLKVTRKGEEINVNVKPVWDIDSESYKIGLWVKEKIAGIGTLTFYDPQTNTYAALGHGIYESRTGTLLDAGNGELLPTEVKSIKEGEVGKPGEIRGVFYGNETAIGKILKNSGFGIYASGIEPASFVKAKPIIMASPDQVKTGNAYILTTIDENHVEKFDIRITKVNRQQTADAKGMEIEVTDSRLLSHCGGILQGMSGSPIIQNNRLIGAVTHVFVNDPTRGYGIFAEWMLNECQSL